MPIYEYRCENGHTFEVIQRMTDDPVTTCEDCGAPVQRVFHPVAVHFKGSGFYNTDYGKKKRARPSSDRLGRRLVVVDERARPRSRRLVELVDVAPNRRAVVLELVAPPTEPTQSLPSSLRTSVRRSASETMNGSSVSGCEHVGLARRRR